MTNEELNEDLFNYQLRHQRSADVFVALELFPEDEFVRVARVVAGDLHNDAYLAWIKMLSLDMDKEGKPKLIPEKIRNEVLSLRRDLKTGKKIVKDTHINTASKQPA